MPLSTGPIESASVGWRIRPLAAGDCVRSLTGMLHRAYAPLAAMGLRYVATDQDEATTRRRCGEGECFVVECERAIVGTVTLVCTRSARHTDSAWYGRPEVAYFGQFGVDPAHQHRGIGRALIGAAERRAVELGAAELALDTAEPATHLVRWYERLGFRFIEYAQWDVTNYRSVIMSKTLGRRGESA